MPPPLKLVAGSDVGRSRYAQLADALRHRVQKGEWTPGGAALPAESALAQEHGVALGTMRRALQLLVDEGLIERIHGRGTFVRSGLAGATMLRFFRFGSDSGEVPLSRIVSAKRAVPPAAVLRRLGRRAGEQALHVVRVRSLGGAPCLLENIWLPLPLFERLADSDTATWGDLLYPMYAKRYGVNVHRAVDDISFGALSAAQARSLELAAGHPCAIVERDAYDISGRCVEVRTTRGDANAFHYTVTLN
jgi:GntR family transcriptional regulator